MDLLIGVSGALVTLFIAIYNGYFIGYPLMLCLLIFIGIGVKRGYPLKDLLIMAFNGGKKSFVILKIFVLIGIITSIWMASGTVPGIVSYSIRYMNPHFFILYAFLITSLISFLLGTAFGTVSTVGVAFIVMARGGAVNLDIVAGAIISGAYFGDRISPMSSSANLVANLTHTNLYGNIKNMFKTGNLAVLACIVIYGFVSFYNPLNLVESELIPQIYSTFNIDPIVLLPTIVILVFSIFKIDVKISMVVSIITAIILCITIQRDTPSQVFNIMINGFHLGNNNPLNNIIKGGGVLSMENAAIVVFISCAMAGVFEKTAMLRKIENIFTRANSRKEMFLCTNIVSFFSAAIGSNQSISIVLTNQLMGKTYSNKGINKENLAVDLENSSIVLAPLIPWSISALIPTTTMMVSSYGYLPYSYFLFLIPLLNFFTLGKSHDIVVLPK